jgi:CheY-like chemotaxis protein
MHALIIEDDVITAMLIEDELRDLGYASFDTASTEQEAIEAVGRRCPDLVTSDGALLVGSGAGAVRHIRSSLHVPVIFITGDKELARNCLPDAPILEKPFSVSQLITAVEQAQPDRPKA